MIIKQARTQRVRIDETIIKGADFRRQSVESVGI